MLFFQNLSPKFVGATVRKGGGVAFSEFVSYFCGTYNTESVNVFSKSERRKFDFDKRIGLTSLHRHIPAIWRGTVAYFVVKVSYGLLFQNKFSAPRFLFLCLCLPGCGEVIKPFCYEAYNLVVNACLVRMRLLQAIHVAGGL